MEKISIPDFTVECGVMRITDPCYDPDVWCSGAVEAENGKWHAAYFYGPTNWHDRVHELVVWHENTTEPDWKEVLTYSGVAVDVDSGQAGFFDHARYVAYRCTKDDDEWREFYLNTICNLTSKDNYVMVPRTLPDGREFESMENHTIFTGGSLPWGVVSASGFGDGGYNCYVVKNTDGKVVAARLVFIDDEMDDEELEESFTDNEE